MESLKKQFAENGLESLWVEYWDNLREWVVMDILEKKVSNLMELPESELSPKEKKLVEMVNSWW